MFRKRSMPWLAGRERIERTSPRCLGSIARRRLDFSLALAGILAATGAQAVNVSADGRGDVLLYPYYTTRADGGGNPYGTLLSVINGQDVAKAVRVRFLEGRNSREVLSFNLFLSPNASWLAAIVSPRFSRATRRTG